MGYSPWGHKQSDMTERLSIAHSQLTNYAVIISGEWQRYSAIHIHVPILPQAPLPSRLPHNVEQSSLCSTVGHVIQYQECLIIHHPFVQSVSIYGTCTCASCCPGPWRQSSLGLCPNMDHILVEKLERKWKITVEHVESCSRHTACVHILCPGDDGWRNSAGEVLCCCCCRCCVASVVSDSVPPQRRQPTRLPCPWDSPGKNSGVGCRFLLQCMKVKSESEVAQSCLTLSDPMDCSLPGSAIHGNFQARVLEWGATAFSTEHVYNKINNKKQYK